MGPIDLLSTTGSSTNCKQERFPLQVLHNILMSIGPENSVLTTLDLDSGY